jgi:hypothetical protein
MLRGAVAIGAVLVVCVQAAALRLPMPADIALSVRDFGARGDGTTDDTDSLQRAIDADRTEQKDYNGRPKTLYFPAGTYLVSGTLDWIGCAMTLQGQGAGSTVIRLAPNAPGFGDPANPKPVIRSPAGNMSFRQNIHDLTIEIAPGNPGAVALDYISSNSGTVRDVEIVAADGSGLVGLDMTRAWPGPLLIKHVRVEGFRYGIKVKHSEYGPRFEGITLEGQTVAGLHNDGNVCAIRDFTSINSVPAIANVAGHGYVILLDGRLGGGSSSVYAIANSGLLYLRNVSCAGSSYEGLDSSAAATEGLDSVGEYVSGDVKKLWDDSPGRSLGLPVRDAPVFHDGDTLQWARFVPRWYGDTGPLQDLLNSGKSTVYFRGGVYFKHATEYFTVPSTVKRIIGFHSVINKNEGPVAIMFRVAENSPDPLIIEQFGYGVGVEHKSDRTVALKHGSYRYYADPGAGDLFFEDVQSDNMSFVDGQSVWMRQLNTEGPELHVTNSGAKLWILGVKTEGKGTVIKTTAGGFTELLGTLLYPCQSFTRSDGPAFIIDNGSASFMYRVSAYVNDGNYWDQVVETRGGETRTWTLENNTHSLCPLFSGYDSTAVAVTPPAVCVPRHTRGRGRSIRRVVGPVGGLGTGSRPVFDLRGRRMRMVGGGKGMRGVLIVGVDAGGVR